MRLTSMRVHNFRAIVETELSELGAINVLVGPNNAGKSSLIRALGLLQEGMPADGGDARLGEQAAHVSITARGLPGPFQVGQIQMVQLGGVAVGLEVALARAGGLSVNIRGGSGDTINVARLPSTEPDHLIVPFLAKRKVAAYDSVVNEANTQAVGPDLRFLTAKLARLSNPAYPAYPAYERACDAILGFVVTAIPAPGGQQPGVYVSNTQTIPISAMGEGVAHIVGLLADLAIAEEKLFLIEEPENDIHPRALKTLLELIEDSSARNQFVVSTHSNIVVRHLGASDGATLHYVDAKRGALPPVAEVRRVPEEPRARIEVLTDLGYELWDFHLWDGWLLLEESSAERIVRDYLIPWFAPRLRRVRTVAVGGNAGVEPAFNDFNRLFRFTHLEDVYRDAAWVVIDGDEEGRQIVEALRERYANSWAADHFRTFSAGNFEEYYPVRFQDRVRDTLAIGNRREKREAKRRLLDEVRQWVEENPAEAKDAFASSAAEVVAVLLEIEAALPSARPTPAGG